MPSASNEAGHARPKSTIKMIISGSQSLPLEDISHLLTKIRFAGRTAHLVETIIGAGVRREMVYLVSSGDWFQDLCRYQMHRWLKSLVQNGISLHLTDSHAFKCF